MKHNDIVSYILFGCALIALCTGALGATTYYVSLGGNDNWPGTSPDSAWRHIAYAATVVGAGDSVLVDNGDYTDEHAVFASSGTAGNPIVLTAYVDSFVMDGLDSTGIAIRMTDKSYISLSNFHIRNYGTGIRGNGLLQNLEISDFTIENINGIGLMFDDDASVQNSIITDFAIRNTNSIAISHFDYSTTDCHDVEISHFLIRDINHEGINWRNSKRVHIHHGEIYNTASDGIHLQLSVDSSTVEYVRVDTTGWHGIAIHDHTVGDYPCSTNVIRYCYVANCGHNDIDLHSGTFNTTVEACTVGGPLTNGQAIYFHNLGAGLVVRNCIIQDVPGEGIDGGPSSGQYLRDILIENNLFYNLSCGISFQGATENITIRGNRIYDTPYDIQVGAYNILIDSNYTENGYYRINGNDGRIFDALDTTYHTRSAYGSFVTVGHTDGKVFEQENPGGYGPYTINKPMWYPNGSYFTMQADSYWCDVDVNTYQMNVVPSTDSLEVLVIDWDTSGTSYKQWQEVCENSSVTTSHTVGEFSEYAPVKVDVDGVLYGMYWANSSGWISFDYTGGFAQDTVMFEAYEYTGINKQRSNIIAEAFSLQVKPNPFSQITEIKLQMTENQMQEVRSKKQDISLKIYDAAGCLVKSFNLVSPASLREAGRAGLLFPASAVSWYGTDNDGKKVPCGVYFYIIKSADGQKQTSGKIVVIR